jgi:hypothetical protein
MERFIATVRPLENGPYEIKPLGCEAYGKGCSGLYTSEADNDN